MSKSARKVLFISLFILTFFLSVLSGNASVFASSVFVDVPSSHFAKKEIEFLYSKKIIKGYKVGKQAEFRPQNNATRAQAAKMIILAIGEEPSSNKKSSFKDVPLNTEATGYIERAYQLGIINGYSDSTYRPNALLTRAQMSKIIANAFQLNVEENKNKPIVFEDIKAGEEFTPYINALYYNGISNGSGNKYKPLENVSRAHFSAFLSRTMSDEFRLPVAEKPGQKETEAKVTASVLNVREAPSTSSDILGQLSFGTIITVKSTTGSWSEIIFNNRTAYVHSDYLAIINRGNPLLDRRIVIDAGHGGTDPGAINGDVQEKAITLEVTKRLESKLKADGARVNMTRSKDTSLSLAQRVEIAKKENAEIFVSVHVNSFGSSSANGTETYYDASKNPQSKESADLAKEIQKQLIQLLKTTDRGVKTAGWYVIKEQTVPSVLAELAFISNDDDLQKLTSEKYQDLFAEAIYLGIKSYFSK